jgi:hypothetical protein
MPLPSFLRQWAQQSDIRLWDSTKELQLVLPSVKLKAVQLVLLFSQWEKAWVSSRETPWGASWVMGSDTVLCYTRDPDANCNLVELQLLA